MCNYQAGDCGRRDGKRYRGTGVAAAAPVFIILVSTSKILTAVFASETHNEQVVMRRWRTVPGRTMSPTAKQMFAHEGEKKKMRRR